MRRTTLAPMSNRTGHLPPLTGVPRLVRELRHQEAMRQGLGLLLMPVFASLAQPTTGLFMLGALLVVLGCLVRLYASGYIMKNQQLATDGPYSLVRHPCTQATFWSSWGLCWPLVTGGPPGGVGLLVVLLSSGHPVRRPEAVPHFRHPWAQWSRTVPAVIPTRLWPSGQGGWSLITSVRRNMEPVVIAFTLLCIAWIGTRV